MEANLVDIFYFVDEFCKEFDKTTDKHLLQKDCSKKSCNHKFRM